MTPMGGSPKTCPTPPDVPPPDMAEAPLAGLLRRGAFRAARCDFEAPHGVQAARPGPKSEALQLQPPRPHLVSVHRFRTGVTGLQTQPNVTADAGQRKGRERHEGTE